MVLGIGLALALVSYTPQDPSWNTAATGKIHNWLGAGGADVADLLAQLFGLSRLLLPLVIVAWGWCIAARKGLPFFGWRVLAALGAMALSDSASGLWNAGHVFAYEGVFGRLLGEALAALLPMPWMAAALSVFVGALALGAFYLACALGLEEWRAIALFFHRIGMQMGAVLNAQTHRLWLFLQSLRHTDGPPIEEEPETGSESVPPVEKPESGKEDPETPPRATKAAVVKRPPVAVRQARLPFVENEHPLPPLDLLQWPDHTKQQQAISIEGLEKNAKLLETVLDDFGVKGLILKVSPGPVVTLYELEPSPGTRAARVISLADDIARNMSAVSVRVATVPGRNVIGIELPNLRRETVYLRELLVSDAYQNSKATLPLVLGKDIAGAPVIADLAKMPHLLIAGTTGSGKSVGINTMILSLLYRLPPQKCRFIMVDPKMLELSVYEGIPHLLAPVVTEPKKAVMALRWAVREMEDRYRAMSKLGVRNVDGYNVRLRDAAKQGETLMRTVQTGFDRETGKPIYEEQPLDLTELPYIVVIVDEMADLMMVAGKEIEAAVQRLAQMARAAGIHILTATQRPSVDVITGTIKANFPTRISFQVTSKIDSRTILGEQGAEQLLGQGDMLYMAGGGRVTRVHAPFVRDQEVESIVRFLKAQGEPDYLDDVTADDGSGVGGDASGGGGFMEDGEGSGDALYDRAVDIVQRERKASTSFIQRQLQIGYNKAANLVERMEREGLIGPANATGKREIFGRNPDEG